MRLNLGWTRYASDAKWPFTPLKSVEFRGPVTEKDQPKPKAVMTKRFSAAGSIAGVAATIGAALSATTAPVFSADV